MTGLNNYYIQIYKIENNLNTYKQCETVINEVNNSATIIIVEFDDNRILLGQYNIIIFNIYNYVIEKIISNE